MASSPPSTLSICRPGSLSVEVGPLVPGSELTSAGVPENEGHHSAGSLKRARIKSALVIAQVSLSIVLVLFPYDGHNPGGVQLATPSVVTCDSTCVTWDMTIPISDMDASEKLEPIRKIIRRDNEKRIVAPAGLIGEETEGDARHLDSAYKSGCRAFFTTDKQDILEHAAELEPLLGIRLFHPDEDRDRFMAYCRSERGG